MTDMILAQNYTAPASLQAVSHFLDGHSVFNSPRYAVFPGFCDVHVHFREPGFSYKETILTGSQAAAHGGYTDVLTMPNLNPVPDNLEKLNVQRDINCTGCLHPRPSLRFHYRRAAGAGMR